MNLFYISLEVQISAVNNVNNFVLTENFMLVLMQISLLRNYTKVRNNHESYRFPLLMRTDFFPKLDWLSLLY